MSDWLIAIPETTESLFANPSFETGVAGWTLVGAGAVATRGVVHQKFGAYGVLIDVAAANCQYYESITVAASPHTLSVFVRNAAGAAITGLTLWFNNASVAAATTTDLGDGWYRLDYTATPTGGARQFGVQVAAAGADIYVDGFQLEAKAYRTTYCDGDQDGCRWGLGAHSSQSVRSAQSRAGGRLLDFIDDLGLNISDMSGMGMMPITQVFDEYAKITGGYTQDYKAWSRPFVLSGLFQSTSNSALLDTRQDFIDYLSPASKPNNQPVLLRYTGATVTKEIMARYEAGLEMGLDAAQCNNERVAIRFTASDPYWRSVGETADALDSNDTDTLRYCAGRLGGLGHATGQWDDLGLSSNPDTNGTIWTILYHSNGYVYFGGDFADWNNAGNDSDYLVRYDPEADMWARCGGASDLNGIVYDLVETPDGNLLVLGAFTDAGAVALADYVTIFDVSAGTYSALADVSTGATITAARCGVYGLDGTLYVGFDGTNVANLADADYVASFSTAGAWAALGTGFNNVVYGCDVDKTTGFIWFAGAFTVADGEAVLYIATYELGATTGSGGEFEGGGGTDGICYDVEITDSGTVYVCGAFTQLGSVTNANKLAFFEPGGWWKSMSTSTTGTPYRFELGPDGMLYVVGTITDIDGLAVQRAAKWNGSTWVQLDVLLPGTPTVWAVESGPPDPVLVQNYDLYLGATTTGAGYFAGSATVNHAGSDLAYPKITVNRSGGTTAELVQIRNETLGAELPFDYDLLDGETLTIDLSPGNRTIISSMFGKRMDAVLSAADFGRFALQAGDNQITCFVDVTGGPTVTANMIWRVTYASVD